MCIELDVVNYFSGLFLSGSSVYLVIDMCFTNEKYYVLSLGKWF